MTKVKWFIFTGTTIVASMLLVVGLIIGFDVYLHHRYEELVGLNIRGYRGPLAKRKQPGEQRIVVLGGSTAFGYGVSWQVAFPARLERRLNALSAERGQGPISVVNLAYNNEGAYACNVTLRDYAYLDYDAALLYTGYNDFGAEQNTYVFRHGSPVFRLTGYLPLLPMILREKAMVLRHGGDLEAAYRSRKTVFRPNLADRTTAAALEQTVRISDSLKRQLERLTSTTASPQIELGRDACPEPWTNYCESVYTAVDYVLNQGKRAIVVTQPYIGDGYRQQQNALFALLAARVTNHPRFRYVNLGHTISLDDRSLAYDGMHLTATGNDIIAEALMEPVFELLRGERYPMTNRPQVWFSMIAVLGSIGLVGGGLAGLASFTWQRVHKTAWNYGGYRGPVLGRKRPGEVRIFALGASTTYGYGVSSHEAYPALLQGRLREANPLPGHQVTVVNLGMMADPAVCLEANLRDYAYLEPDTVIIYAGDNGGWDDERTCRRQSSPFFRLFKILPVFLIVLREKWYQLHYGNVAEGYRRYRRAHGEFFVPEKPGDVAFQPLTEEQKRLVKQLGPVAGQLEPFREFEQAYQPYERNITHLIDTALSRHLAVLFVYQVDIGSGTHQYLLQRIRTALGRYEGQPLFRTADASQLFGGQMTPEYFATWMHLNAKGNDRLAEFLVAPTAELLLARARALGDAHPDAHALGARSAR